MITIDQDLTFTQDVTVNKKAFQAKFEMQFKLLGQQELQDLLSAWMRPPSADPQAIAPTTDMQFVERVATGWGDVSDANGPVAFGPEPLAKLCNLPGVKSAIIDAFLGGYEEAVEKNSLPPLAT